MKKIILIFAITLGCTLPVFSQGAESRTEVHMNDDMKQNHAKFLEAWQSETMAFTPVEIFEAWTKHFNIANEIYAFNNEKQIAIQEYMAILSPEVFDKENEAALEAFNLMSTEILERHSPLFTEEERYLIFSTTDSETLRLFVDAFREQL